ncbi:VTT domain-containing protein [Actinoplanes sp. NPDC024001]|uniref:DedA family protein n=1 Tax=Actinoplanes sp. NPDC024001 TaxID=3154598 RepID=UPI00340B6882
MQETAAILDAAAAAGWLLPAVFAVVALDAVVPVLPSGTVVTAAGVLSASGRVHVAAVVLAAAAAAYLGDNLVYTLGRRGRLLVSGGGPRRQRTYAWVSQGLRTRPASVIVPSRFVPGVRTAVMVYAGAAGCPPRLFRRLSAAGALVWATACALSGYLGGLTFGQHPLPAMAMALAVGAGVAVVAEASGKRLRHRSLPEIRQDVR